MRLLFTKNDRLVSRLIRKVTRGDCSHVGIEIAPGIVLQSEWDAGVQLITRQQLLANNELVAELEIEEKDYSRLLPLVGRDYDRLAILKLLVQYLTPGFGNPFPEKPDSFICTEIVSMLISGEEKPISPALLLSIMKEKTR